MDMIKMGLQIDPIGIVWGMFLCGAVICSVAIVIIVHISFAIAVFRDATSLPAPQKPISVSPIIWFLAILLGGIFVTTLYWIMHHSRLNQSIPPTLPED